VLLERIIPVASPPVPVVDVAVLRARAEPVGRAATFADTAKVSPLTVVADKVTGIETVIVSPTAAAVVVNVPIDIVPVAALAAGTAVTDKSPPINAATATSAMRLKVVFVDICFLSISRVREFPDLGLNQISLVRFDESHVLIHQIPHRVSGRGEETYLFVFHLHSLR